MNSNWVGYVGEYQKLKSVFSRPSEIVLFRHPNIQTAFVKPTDPTTCYNPIFIFSNVFKRKTE